MIHFINKELFKLKSETKEIGNQKVLSTVAYSSVFVKDVRNPEKKINRIVGIITSDTDPEKDPANGKIWVQNVQEDNREKKVLKISCSDKNRYDMNIFFVAIPFNGFLEPIPEDYGYRIYRSVFVTGERQSIEFHGKMYKKILYLILVPNMTLFSKDNEHHRDVIEFVTNSYHLESNPEDRKNKRTVKVVNTLRITNNLEDIQHMDTTSTIVDPIKPDAFKNVTLVPIYDPTKNRSKSEEGKKETPKTPVKVGITTNKNKASKSIKKVADESRVVFKSGEMDYRPMKDIDNMLEDFNNRSAYDKPITPKKSKYGKRKNKRR